MAGKNDSNSRANPQTAPTEPKMMVDDNPEPAVSIVVPCRNERDHIEAALQSILAQDPPLGGFEVIVADGMSSDGTRDILDSLAREDPRLRIIDNPGLSAPCARNVGIRESRGRHIAIMDAHAEYAPDYIRACIEILEDHPDILCSGGPISSQGTTLFGRAVAAAMSHPVGIGNAKHRLPEYEGYAEGACFPVFRRETFDKFGLFDETLIRNQDDEFNFRIARQGGKIFISHRARCIYHVRETPSQLFKQYFQYGYWRVAVLRKHNVPASLRQLAPIGFLCLLIASLIVSLTLPGWLRLTGAVIPLAYLSILCAVGARIAAREGIPVGLQFPIAAAAMHLAYSGGFIFGIFGGDREKMSTLSRGETKMPHNANPKSQAPT